MSAAPLTPIEASVDCHDCPARAGEIHFEGCGVYAMYNDDDAFDSSDGCHHGVGFDERCGKCEAEMEFDE